MAMPSSLVTLEPLPIEIVWLFSLRNFDRWRSPSSFCAMALSPMAIEPSPSALVSGLSDTLTDFLPVPFRYLITASACTNSVVLFLPFSRFILPIPTFEPKVFHLVFSSSVSPIFSPVTFKKSLSKVSVVVYFVNSSATALEVMTFSFLSETAVALFKVSVSVPHLEDR